MPSNSSTHPFLFNMEMILSCHVKNRFAMDTGITEVLITNFHGSRANMHLRSSWFQGISFCLATLHALLNACFVRLAHYCPSGPHSAHMDNSNIPVACTTLGSALRLLPANSSWYWAGLLLDSFWQHGSHLKYTCLAYSYLCTDMKITFHNHHALIKQAWHTTSHNASLVLFPAYLVSRIKKHTFMPSIYYSDLYAHRSNYTHQIDLLETIYQILISALSLIRTSRSRCTSTSSVCKHHWWHLNMKDPMFLWGWIDINFHVMHQRKEGFDCRVW